MENRLLYEEKNRVGYITLNRPEVHNAFDDRLILELQERFASLSSTSLRAIVLQSKGKSFSAGADLNWMQKMKNTTLEENLSDARALGQMIAHFFTCPIPTIARIQGNAFGGGVGLVAACDYTFALESAKFAFSEAKLGLAPACIARPVVFRMGAHKAKRLFLTGEIFSAIHARETGLVDEIASTEEELDQKIQALLEKLLLCSPQAQKACKELTQKIETFDLEKGQMWASEIIARLRVSEEGQEGVRAFLEKRKPNF